jgi:hypothetical protein
MAVEVYSRPAYIVREVSDLTHKSIHNRVLSCCSYRGTAFNSTATLTVATWMKTKRMFVAAYLPKVAVHPSPVWGKKPTCIGPHPNKFLIRASINMHLFDWGRYQPPTGKSSQFAEGHDNQRRVATECKYDLPS